MAHKYTHLGPGVLEDEFNPEAAQPVPNEPRGPFNKLAEEYVPPPGDPEPEPDPVDPEPPTE